MQARAHDLAVQMRIWTPREARQGLSMDIQGGSEQAAGQRRGVVTRPVEKLMYLVGLG